MGSSSGIGPFNIGRTSTSPGAGPGQTAAAQTATNIGTAIAQQNLNNVNQVTPYGNLTYEQTGTHTYTDPHSGKTHEIPTYTATQSLSPGQQRIFDQSQQAQYNFANLAANQSSKLNQVLGKPIDVDGLPNAGDASAIRQTNLQRMGSGPQLQTGFADAGDIKSTYGTDFSQDRQRVEDALMERMAPGLEQDRQRLESRLASQGINIGSEAYKNAMLDFNRQTNDARLGAILGAGQEQSRLAGLEQSRAGYELAAQGQKYQQALGRTNFGNATQQQMHDNKSRGITLDNQAAIQEANADTNRFNAMNTARDRALQETMAVRNSPINEITALMSGSQVTQPNFITPQTAQIANTDYAGIQNAYTQNKLTKRGQNMDMGGSLFSGLSSMGAAGIKAGMFSDKRVKKDIKKVGKTNDGQPIYSFRYKGGGPIQMGLMAQDVEKKKPKAVSKGPGGVKMVNYGIALGGARR